MTSPLPLRYEDGEVGHPGTAFFVYGVGGKIPLPKEVFSEPFKGERLFVMKEDRRTGLGVEDHLAVGPAAAKENGERLKVFFSQRGRKVARAGRGRLLLFLHQHGIGAFLSQLAIDLRQELFRLGIPRAFLKKALYGALGGVKVAKLVIELGQGPKGLRMVFGDGQGLLVALKGLPGESQVFAKGTPAQVFLGLLARK
jgi:hypothetical protein